MFSNLLHKLYIIVSAMACLSSMHAAEEKYIAFGMMCEKKADVDFQRLITLIGEQSYGKREMVIDILKKKDFHFLIVKKSDLLQDTTSKLSEIMTPQAKEKIKAFIQKKVVHNATLTFEIGILEVTFEDDVEYKENFERAENETLDELKAYKTVKEALYPDQNFNTSSFYFINFKEIEIKEAYVAFEIVCEKSITSPDIYLQDFAAICPESIRSVPNGRVPLSGGKSFQLLYRYFLVLREKELTEENQALADTTKEQLQGKVQKAIDKVVSVFNGRLDTSTDTVTEDKSSISFFTQNSFEIQGKGALKSYPTIKEALQQDQSYRLSFIKKVTKRPSPDSDDDGKPKDTSGGLGNMVYGIPVAACLLIVFFLYIKKASAREENQEDLF
ncbi:MAG: hypothetical protein AAF335_01690 [Bacteroidota bacterium]